MALAAPARRDFAPLALLLVLGAGLTASFVWSGVGPRPHEGATGHYLAAYYLGFAFYSLALLFVLRAGTRFSTRGCLAAILGFAILFRGLSLAQQPTLSTDIYRYLWDGRIAAQGINPYRYAPLAPQEKPLRPHYWHIINHKWCVTMYPPLSQMAFLAIHETLGEHLIRYKLVFALFDLATILALMAMLRKTGRPLALALAYAWHPLVVSELAVSGHQDAIGIFFMVAAMLALGLGDRKKEALLGGILAGLSVASKGYLVPALPVMGRRRPVLFGLALTVACVLVLLPYVGAGRQILVGLVAYLHNRIRNAGLFLWTHELLSHYRPHPLSWSLNWTRKLAVLALLGIMARTAWKPARDVPDVMRRSAEAMGGFFLVSHTVYPWYAVWIIPSFCFGTALGWFVWTGLIPLAYLNPRPYQSPWAPHVEYGITLALLAAEALWRWRVARRGATPRAPAEARPAVAPVP